MHLTMLKWHTSWQVFMTTAILEMRSAACWRTLADLLFKRHRMVPQICGRYALTRLPRALTTVPNPFSITISYTQNNTNTAYINALPEILVNKKALPRGRTDHFSTKNSTNTKKYLSLLLIYSLKLRSAFQPTMHNWKYFSSCEIIPPVSAWTIT